jgi:hypothetical protein
VQRVWKKNGIHVHKLNSTILATEHCVDRKKYVESFIQLLSDGLVPVQGWWAIDFNIVRRIFAQG